MRHLLTGTLLLLACASTAHGQGQKPLIIVDGVVQAEAIPTKQDAGDPFARYFFPPDFVMQHQGDIGLTDAQRATMTSIMQQAQGKFIEAQFKLAAESEKLVKTIQGSSIDETQTLEAVDRVLALEREVKRAQVSLMVRIKNVLTPQQQAKLTQMRGR